MMPISVQAAALVRLVRLPRIRRWIVALISATGLVAVVVYGRMSPEMIPSGDLAVGELYADLAARGELLFGPYSRFLWHHPGPLFFYLSAPFYALAGHRAAALFAFA